MSGLFGSTPEPIAPPPPPPSVATEQVQAAGDAARRRARAAAGRASTMLTSPGKQLGEVQYGTKKLLGQ